MIVQALIFLVDTILGLYAAALLIRFYLQVARAPARNQISQFVGALTDPVVRPARRLVPGWGGLDLATLVLAWLTEFILLTVVRLIETLILPELPVPLLGFAVLAAINILRLSIYILMGALILQAVLSWVAPYSPVAPIVNGITRPFVRPIQKRMPLIGNVDLSPLVLIIVLQLVLMVPVNWLTAAVRAAFGA